MITENTVKDNKRVVRSLVANTPQQLCTQWASRFGVVIHNRSLSAANVLVVVVPEGTAVDNTYIQTNGNIDFELGPGDSMDVSVSSTMEVWGVSVAFTATVAVQEYVY